MNFSFPARIKNAWRGFKQAWGTSRMKQALWNKEFLEGKWNFIENTSQDIIYPYLERYCHGGSILDLGCGSGNTGCELNPAAYSSYTGVDISDVALARASTRARAGGRDKKNGYVQADIASYAPARKYDVILFRESIYYIPSQRIPRMLDGYSRFLQPEGVFIIRRYDKNQAEAFLEMIRPGYAVVDQDIPAGAGPMLVVLKPIMVVPVSFLDPRGPGISQRALGESPSRMKK